MPAPPRLARGVTITRRQISEEESYYLVRDPRGGSFLRMGEAEAAVLRLLDGTRTLEEVSEALERNHGIRAGVPVIETFLRGLTRRGLVESRTFDPSEFRQEWASQQRTRRRTLGQLLGSLAYLKVHLFNPQRLFALLVKPLAFVWTPAFVAVTLALMAVAAVLSVSFHQEILRSAHTFYVDATSSGAAFVSSAVVFYLVLFLVVAVHEMAHGLTCARFGGKVTDMGFILFYLQVPGMYCDITDAYSFERRSQRLWTTFAGSYTGLLLAAIGVFLWWMSEPGDTASNAGIMLMFIGGPPALAFNWNPLLRLDGYYMLMDFLEAPNLMDNSYKYLGYLIKSRLLRVPVDPMPVPHRLRRAYVIYGIASGLFLAPWILYMPVVAYYIFARLFGDILALPIAAFIGWRMLSRPLSKIAETTRYAWLSHRVALAGGQAGRARVAALAAGAVAALALALFGPRFAVKAEGVGTLEPAERVEVRASWAGFVTPPPAMPVEGDRVKAGQLLVRLSDPELIMTLDDMRLQSASLRTEQESLVARGDPAGAAAKETQQRAAAAQAAILAERARLLELTAPIAGVVLTPHLPDRAGRYLRSGETWCVVGRVDRLRVRVPLTERDLGVIDSGSVAEVKGVHLPTEIFHGRVTRMPAGRRPDRPPDPDASRFGPSLSAAVGPGLLPPQPAVSGSLDVDVEVDDPGALLRPGITVRVRIYGERLTLAGHVARWAHRLFKGKMWW